MKRGSEGKEIKVSANVIRWVLALPLSVFDCYLASVVCGMYVNISIFYYEVSMRLINNKTPCEFTLEYLNLSCSYFDFTKRRLNFKPTS